MLLVRLGGERWDYKKFIKHASIFFLVCFARECHFLKPSSVFVDFQVLKCLFILLLVQSCDMMTLRVRHHFFFEQLANWL